MERYAKLESGEHKKNEEELREYWKGIDLLRESVDTRKDGEAFVFYEGPPTANGKPGIHHVLSRTVKDTICRYKTMQGYQVKRKAGWDTHGLPVELEVEKKLGLKSKADIEEYGVGAFTAECRASVFEYEAMWREMTEKMGYLIDLDNPYITLDNDYIESVWWIFDKLYKKGLFYEGVKVVPYCTRCGTPVSAHELAQGYKDVKTNTLYVKFKLEGTKNEYFLAWTTTAWTLPANMALAVSPTETYVKVKQGDEIYYLAKALVSKALVGEYEVLGEMTGKELEYVKYEPVITDMSQGWVEGKEKAFYVILADYVTATDGTGIVHIAPAFGEDDYNAVHKYNMNFNDSLIVDNSGNYTATQWKGQSALSDEVELSIIKLLHNEGKLYKKEKIEHKYPHCWRCSTPLMYLTRHSYYLQTTAVKQQMIENNKKVNWYPTFVGEGRFGDWLDNLKDWAVARSRYWGTPINLWVCDKCGCKTTVSSKQELAEKAQLSTEEVCKLDLHRPHIDEVEIPCAECGGVMKRIPEVFDCWFDSGAMPYAQHHYPFENAEQFDKLFPADFISEGLDQTRGWFYSLLAISTMLNGELPYKNVAVNNLVLDKNGKKMSKSLGNTVNPFEMFDKYGADAVRWYLFYTSPVWTPKSFDEAGLREVYGKFFGTLTNIYNFFSLYAKEVSGYTTEQDFEVNEKHYRFMDRWLMSRYNTLVQNVTEALEQYNPHVAVKEIQAFVVDDLSNWYVRCNRRRYWTEENTEDKRSAFKVLYDVLLGVSKLIAPICPYHSEWLYLRLTDGKSVHLENYPTVDGKWVNLDIEKVMGQVEVLVSIGRAAREKAKIKIRQQLGTFTIPQDCVDYWDTVGGKALQNECIGILKEELNLKTVNSMQESELEQYVDYKLKPNFAVLGSMLGDKLKEVVQYLSTNGHNEVYGIVEAGECRIGLSTGEYFNLQKEHLLVQMVDKEHFVTLRDRGLFGQLHTKLTPDLIENGLMRELVSKVQQMRKAVGFEVLDNIKIGVYSNSEVLTEVIEKEKDYIKNEVVAEQILAYTEIDRSRFELMFSRVEALMGKESVFEGNLNDVEVKIYMLKA